MKYQFYGLLALFIVGISGCGGGGSGNDSTPPVTVSEQEQQAETPEQEEQADTTEQDEQPETPVQSVQPNILLIIADDQGLDASAQYNYSDDLPSTPTIDSLAANGLVFDNAWATPSCTTTRATMISGKYGFNSGVTFTPAQLSQDNQSLQGFLAQNTESQDYASAVFGKWHLAGGGRGDSDHPQTVGVDHYAGNLANLDDYFQWSLTINGEVQTSTEYHTTAITNLAIDWIAEQETPWFAWVAYSAPHAPFHLPPQTLHSRDLPGTRQDINANRRAYYLAAIEAMDTEIGRMLDSMDEQTRANTLIMYIGDNGTPARIIDTNSFDQSHAKGSLYQGGIAVPLIVSGAGVERVNQRESALVTATDIFATIAEAAGTGVTEVFDSVSFYPLLSDSTAPGVENVFTQFESAAVTGVTVRNAEYKLIQFNNGDEEFYRIDENFLEQDNLITDPSLVAEIQQLQDLVEDISNTETSQSIDISNAILTNQSRDCADYVASYMSNVTDVARSALFVGNLDISITDESCVFSTNAIPNHDFNDGDNGFANNVAEQNDRFEVSRTPTVAEETTALSLQVDNAILLNGVKVDLLAAGCFGVGDGKVGCNDMSTPWRFDPMHAANGFRVDSHNAHAQADGTYHYHGSPFALYAEDSSQVSPVIGFAADGFPIFGSYIEIDGVIRKARSSYALKQGARPASNGQPGGDYDGRFIDDYEYIAGGGDLDECNGMTVNGQYGYYVTDTYPYVLGCFVGTPDPSFNK